MAWLGDGMAVVRRVFRRVPPAEQPQRGESKVAVLRRGLSAEYYFYFEIFAKQNGLDFVIDRRVAERRREPGRVSEDRRSTDRRGPLPPTWNQADIVIPQSNAPELKAAIKPKLVAVPSPQR